MSSLLDAIEGSHQKLLRPSGGCHNCPRKRVDFVPATLRKTKVLFLGEAPGATEVEKQEGFVGKAGELLRKHAGLVGIDDFSLTNTIHCRPPNNVAPKPKEVECCLSQLILDEIRGYPIVVMCGSAALQALFPSRGSVKTLASHYRGNVAHHPDFPEQQFYMIYHPSYILRNPRLEGRVFRQQMERLGRLCAGEPPRDWQVLQGGGEEMWAALEKALAQPLISADLETTDLKSWDPHERIRSVAITGDGNTAVFAHEHEPHWLIVLEKLRAFLEQPTKSIVGSNVAFDIDWLEHKLDFTACLTGIHELSAIWYQAAQYTQPSLKTLVAEQLDGYRYLVYSPAHEKDLELLANYNGEDVIYGYRLFQKGIRLLKPKTRDLVTRTIGPVSLCLRQMQSTGFYVRRDYRQQKIEEYDTRRKEVLAAWQAEDPAFLPTVHESGKGLAKYLFEIHGLSAEGHGRTDSGKTSVDKAAVKLWIGEGATYLKHLLDLREIDKIKSTYLTGYDKHIDNTSRVHSRFPVTRTDTGRTSSSDPNLQNIPRKPEIRDLFGVPSGAELLEADLNQIEFRIMVCLAKDPTGIEAYIRGDDAHTTTAKAFTDGAPPTKEQRSCAKPVNFALIYGGDWSNVQRQARVDFDLDWSETQCKEFVRFFVNTYKRLPEFHRECMEELLQNRGWFESVLGHTFFYKDWDNTNKGKQDHMFRAALNSRGQGPAAQICFTIMVHARRLMQARGLSKQAPYVNHVHDSVMTQVSSHKHVEHIVETFEEAVAEVYEWVKPWFVVPLVMDYKLGDSWGSLEDYKIR